MGKRAGCRVGIRRTAPRPVRLRWSSSDLMQSRKLSPPPVPAVLRQPSSFCGTKQPKGSVSPTKGRAGSSASIACRPASPIQPPYAGRSSPSLQSMSHHHRNAHTSHIITPHKKRSTHSSFPQHPIPTSIFASPCSQTTSLEGQLGQRTRNQ